MIPFIYNCNETLFCFYPSYNHHNAVVSQGLVNKDILLVHGVFGSGKSHLLAAICVFIKRLSALVDVSHTVNAPSNHTQTNHHHRPAAGTGSSSRVRVPSIRCMVSANTNVAGTAPPRPPPRPSPPPLPLPPMSFLL